MQNFSNNVFIFDFDGVLCNSIEECMIVSFHTYHGLSLFSKNIITYDMKKYFYKYRHLVRPAGEYYLIWDSYYNNPNFNIVSFEKLKKQKNAITNEFQNNFFINREKLKEETEYWLSLHTCYKNTLNFLERNADSFFVVTTKDKDSVERISSEHGYFDRIKGIYSKEISTDKSVLFNRLLQDNEIFSKGNQLYYVDDHSQNIATVSNLKIPNLICIFARWGYSDKVISSSNFNVDDIMDIEAVMRF
jgi:phosphoglycolate phosphatase-like HAD superfamily hydrolase